jgi:TatD DNase family protein
MPQNTDLLDEHIDKIRKMLFIPEVIALGEIGLDRMHGPNLWVQKAYLAELFQVAAESDETIIVHCVRCFPELTALKKKFAPHQKILLHGFNSKIKLLQNLVKDGFYISLSPQALQREDLCAFIREKSEILRHICLETDDSSFNIKDVYESAAQALKLERTELSLLMKANFVALFQGTINE